MPGAFSITVRVRYAECDMQGHVFNGHFLTWCDMAHTALLEHVLGRSYVSLVESGIDVMVAEASVRYRAPAHFDDELEVSAEPEPLTESSMTTRFTVKRADTLIAEGKLRHVCAAAPQMRKRPWPDEIRDAFASYASPPGAPA